MIVLLGLLLFSQLGHAEDPEWFLKAIKVKNPNQLGYFFEVNHNCPVTKKEGQTYARKHNMDYFEISVKKKDNVSLFFYDFIKSI